MEKFFEDPSSITEEEIVAAIRKGTLAMDIVPMTQGSSFKNKGVQTLLDYVCMFLPSPLDTPNIVVQTPKLAKRKTASRAKKNTLQLSHSRLLPTLCRPSDILPRLLW